MKTTAALLLAAGTCGAGFLAGWLVFHSDGTCKVEVPPAPAARAEPEQAGSPALTPDLARLDSRQVIAPSSLPTEVLAAGHDSQVGGTKRGTSNRHGTFPFSDNQSREWQAKYEGKTLAELDWARESIERAIDNAAHPILKDMLLHGEGTLIPKDKTFTSKDNEAVSLMLAKGNGGGVYLATLPPDEYPSIYELRYESIWLTYAIGGRFRGAGTPYDK